MARARIHHNNQAGSRWPAGKKSAPSADTKLPAIAVPLPPMGLPMSAAAWRMFIVAVDPYPTPPADHPIPPDPDRNGIGRHRNRFAIRRRRLGRGNNHLIRGRSFHDNYIIRTIFRPLHNYPAVVIRRLPIRSVRLHIENTPRSRETKRHESGRLDCPHGKTHKTSSKSNSMPKL